MTTFLRLLLSLLSCYYAKRTPFTKVLYNSIILPWYGINTTKPTNKLSYKATMISRIYWKRDRVGFMLNINMSWCYNSAISSITYL